jgi:maleate isomerase
VQGSKEVLTIGVLTPHAAAGADEELPAMARGQVSTRVARIGRGDPPSTSSGLRALTAPTAVDEALATLAAEPIGAIAYASTTSAYAIGYDDETTMASRLEDRTGLPAAATCASAVLALRRLNAASVALVHPPWFADELHDLGEAYFRSQGFEVVMCARADLSLDPRRIEPGDVVDWVSRHVVDASAAVFIGGNGFRAAGAIETLETALDRPVLESNQVLLWGLLARAALPLDVRGLGRLFAHP